MEDRTPSSSGETEKKKKKRKRRREEGGRGRKMRDTERKKNKIRPEVILIMEKGNFPNRHFFKKKCPYWL